MRATIYSCFDDVGAGKRQCKKIKLNQQIVITFTLSTEGKVNKHLFSLWLHCLLIQAAYNYFLVLILNLL